MRIKTSHQRRVEEFMLKAKQAIPDRPTLPDEKTRLLRARLILEEALETVRALGFDFVPFGNERMKIQCKEDFRTSGFAPNGRADLAEVADGCADIMVVTTGTLSACGISDDSLQREVDGNNLRKFEHHCPRCDGPGLGDDSPAAPIKGQRVCHKCGEMWVSGYHDEHGKWVKPSTHRPPRIAWLLEEQARFAEQATKETAPMPSIADRPRCYGERYTPSSSECAGCPHKNPCIAKLVG